MNRRKVIIHSHIGIYLLLIKMHRSYWYNRNQLWISPFVTPDMRFFLQSIQGEGNFVDHWVTKGHSKLRILSAGFSRWYARLLLDSWITLYFVLSNVNVENMIHMLLSFSQDTCSYEWICDQHHISAIAVGGKSTDVWTFTKRNGEP